MAKRLGTGIQLIGVPELQRALKRLGPAALDAAGSQLLIEAENIVGKAKQQTPVNFGTLRASGHVQGPDFTGNTATVVMGFGGPAGIGNHQGDTNDKKVGYAVIVHEQTGARHKVGNRKYLELPMLEAVNGMASRIAKGLRQHLNRLNVTR